MEFLCRVHALLPAEGGLHLWVERVEGRVVITDAGDLNDGDLPPELLELVQARPFRHRGTVQLATPKGKVKKVAVPTVAFTPEQSLSVLNQLNVVRGKQEKVGENFSAGLSADVLFVLNLYRLAYDIVRAGRVMLRMDRIDNEWMPRWMPSTAGSHHRVIQQLRDTAPIVLARNGSVDVVGDAVDELVHWMSVVVLQEGLAGTEDINTPFMRAVLAGEPARRVSAETVSQLNKWRVTAADAASSVVLILSSPSDATLATPSGSAQEQDFDPSEVPIEDVRWRLDIGLSMNDGPVEVLVPSEMTEAQSTRLYRAMSHMRASWTPLAAMLAPVEAWFSTGVWQPQIPTGQPTKDRAMSVALTMEDVEQLLTHGVRTLRGAGVQVMVPRGWTRAQPRVSVAVNPVGGGAGSGKLGMDQLVNFEWDVSVEGQSLAAEERQSLVNAASNIVAINGQFVFLDTSSLSQARGWFKAVQKKQGKETGDSEAEAEDIGATDLTNGDGLVTLRDVWEADALASDFHENNGDHNFHIEAGGWMERLMSDQPVEPPQPVRVPDSVRTTLRDHQQRGVNWLAWMAQHQLGAILADDMGLGKTLQVLALMALEKAELGGSEPSLVIAPTSVLESWRNEVKRHTPEMTVLVDHGSSKAADGDFADKARGHDVVVTSYGTVSRNPERYRTLTWHRVVADEAQNIKNPGTKQSRAVRSLPAGHRIALTGTPVENRLSDLFAIMDFANPGILGSPAAFQNRLAIPIERYQDDAARNRLQRVVQPFVLRRLKTEASVGLNLPAKQENVELIPLTNEQAALYQAYTQSMEQKLRDREESRRGMILGALVKIKQICNHPAHYANDGSALLRLGRHRSHKVRRMFEIIDQARADGRKVLVFTQFPSFGRMLIPEMNKKYGVDVPMLHGGLSRTARVQMVEDFQSPDGQPIMVLSVRAGGTGITLTEASVVIHIDRWWNPAVEDQATDRAYRIGQDKEVTVYKLVSKGTLDERIHDIISGKRELAGAVIGAGEGWIANLDDADLRELWRLKTASEESIEGQP